MEKSEKLCNDCILKNIFNKIARLFQRFYKLINKIIEIIKFNLFIEILIDKIKELFKFLGIVIKEIMFIVPGIFVAMGLLKNKSDLKIEILQNKFIMLYDFMDKQPVKYWLLTTFVTLGIQFILIAIPLRKEKKKNKIEYTEKEINKEYEDYIKDTKSLYICGGKLDFLNSCKSQLDGIEKLSDCCTILSHYNKNQLDKKNKEMYKKLIKNGVKLKNVNMNNYFYLKGQIKENKAGVLSALFSTKQQNGLYKKIEINDQKIAEMLKKEMEKIYKESSFHPYIRYVLMDLGGVYFKGDFYSDFMDKIKDMIEGKELAPKKEHKLLLSKKLNLGDETIIQFLEQELAITIEKQNIKKIKEIWKMVWSPDERMKEIVISLKDQGMEVYPCSNLDEENTIEYFSKGYFNEFSEKMFFSHVMKKVKPTKEYYQEVIRQLKEKDPELCEFEILLIDDLSENIEMASSLGFETLLFKNFEKLEMDLEKFEILAKARSAVN